MSADLMFQIVAAALLIGGAFVAWRFGWRDPGKGTRRCPKCWYEMTAGMKCPECGNEAETEKQLHWSRRRLGWIAAGAVLAAGAYPAWKWPLYQRVGWVGFVPRVVTLALLPEISDAIRKWAPRKTHSGPLLVLDLARSNPLDRVERFALAHSYRRVLLDPDRTPGYKAEFSFLAFGNVGDQLGVTADAIAFALSQPGLQPAAMDAIARSPPLDDARMMKVVAPALRAMGRNDLPYPADKYLEKLQAWGATDDQLRTAAFGAIDSDSGHGAMGSVMQFVWRENLVRASDRERLIGYLQKQVWPFAEYASYCAAELGDGIAEIVPLLREKMAEADLQAIPDWTCLAIGMRGASEPLLPALDRFANFKRYPTFKVCGLVGGLAVRGFHSEAFDLWLSFIEKSENTNAESVPQRYQISPLVMVLDVPASRKAEGLVRVVQLEASSATPTSASGNLIFAIDALGKLGADAGNAVPAMFDLITPNTMPYLVERVLSSIEKIRPLNAEEMKTLERLLVGWDAIKCKDATIEARMDRIRRAGSRPAR